MADDIFSPGGAVHISDGLMTVKNSVPPGSTLLVQPDGASNFAFDATPEADTYVVLSETEKPVEGTERFSWSVFRPDGNDIIRPFDTALHGRAKDIRMYGGSVCVIKSLKMLPDGAPLGEQTGAFHYTAFNASDGVELTALQTDFSEMILDFGYGENAICVLRKERVSAGYSLSRYSSDCDPQCLATFRLDMVFPDLFGDRDFCVQQTRLAKNMDYLYTIIWNDRVNRSFLCRYDIKTRSGTVMGEYDAFVPEISDNVPLGVRAMNGTEKVQLVDVSRGQVLAEKLWGTGYFHCWDSRTRRLYFSAAATEVQTIDMRKRRESALSLYYREHR